MKYTYIYIGEVSFLGEDELTAKLNVTHPLGLSYYHFIFLSLSFSLSLSLSVYILFPDIFQSNKAFIFVGRFVAVCFGGCSIYIQRLAVASRQAEARKKLDDEVDPFEQAIEKVLALAVGLRSVVSTCQLSCIYIYFSIDYYYLCMYCFRNVPQLDFHSKSDPEVTIYEKIQDKWVFVGRTPK